jgi:hypothetical protein
VATQNGLDWGESRYEPETFGKSAVPADPYAAWVQQREAEREREHHDDSQVRWVYRPRTAADPMIGAGTGASRQAIQLRDERDRSSSARLTTV